MKLSEKGLDKVYGLEFDQAQGFPVKFEDLEFDQNDFQGAVLMRVEEAKLLFKVIDGFFDLRLPTTKEIVALNKLKVRVERIEQAEMKDE